MTREEAIVIMENERPHCGKRVTFTEEEKYEAYDMAIEALKAEPCEGAVSREFMYKLGAKCIAARNENGVLVAIASIESLPPVTPKPLDAVLDKIRAEFKIKADGDDWYHTTDGIVWEEAIEIIDKHRKGESE